MFLIGLCIHLIFLFSIFDIYFKSPIINDVVPYVPHHDAVADRLVLFVVDGLRAESFVNYTTMPYLRDVANSFGRWGISNTRVPTESRPGHVAVIAGFYEDPSAVAKGWKENPVDFDSVFNQTSNTWCWGAYDIIDIFTKGNDHIHVNKFDPYDHTFSTNKNTTLLDSWVFENVARFLRNAKHNIGLIKKLNEKKTVFFFHLLGTDTSGHMHKPKTQNFLTTIRFVDEGIKQLENLIKEFYNNDGKTTFLMTSDHGMTDWGSHGSGDDHETQTPYVLWGAGVQQIQDNILDIQTVNMSLNHRLDINQADLAPLMATILSIPVPVNSISTREWFRFKIQYTGTKKFHQNPSSHLGEVQLHTQIRSTGQHLPGLLVLLYKEGTLPADLLNMSLANKAKAIYSNSRQLASQYNRKRMNVEANVLSVLHQPYKPFDQSRYDEIIALTEKFLADENYEKSILLSKQIMDLSLSGLEYYHNYYQRPLLFLVSLSFIGWSVCLLKVLLMQKMRTHIDASNTSIGVNPKNNFMNKFFLFLFLVSFYLVYAQNLPVQYYLYFLMPVILWWFALSSDVWMNTLRQFKKDKELFKVPCKILFYTIGSIAMGLSFTYRWMLSIPLLGMAVWPFVGSMRHHLPTRNLIEWPIGCILLSLFSFLPVVGKNAFIELVVLAGVIWLVNLTIHIRKVLLPVYCNNKESGKEMKLCVMQMLLLALSLHNVYVQQSRFEMELPVSQSQQTFAWVLAAVSLLMPLLYSKRLINRLMAVNTSILNLYLLLSVAHEGLFIVVLNSNILNWIVIESKANKSQNDELIESTFEEDQNLLSYDRSVCSEDFRRSFFFLLYIILAFFGTGNIASLNSFEVRWVTCFITSYQPFIITGLILLKTLSPFLCVACSFRAVQHVTKAPTSYLNIIVLIYSNIMGIQLLFNVKNRGSWLEIGTSISQFVIVQVITLFIVLIYQIAKILTSIDIYSFTYNIFKYRKKYV